MKQHPYFGYRGILDTVYGSPINGFHGLNCYKSDRWYITKLN